MALIQRNPLQSAGIAAGVGFVAALVTRVSESSCAHHKYVSHLNVGKLAGVAVAGSIQCSSTEEARLRRYRPPPSGLNYPRSTHGSFMRWALISLLVFVFLILDMSKNHGQYTRSISASLDHVWRQPCCARAAVR